MSRWGSFGEPIDNKARSAIIISDEFKISAVNTNSDGTTAKQVIVSGRRNDGKRFDMTGILNKIFKLG